MGDAFLGRDEQEWALELWGPRLSLRWYALRALAELGAHAVLLSARDLELWPHAWALAACAPEAELARKGRGRAALPAARLALAMLRLSPPARRLGLERCLADLEAARDEPAALQRAHRLVALHGEQAIVGLLGCCRRGREPAAGAAAWALGRLGRAILPDTLEALEGAGPLARPSLATALWYLGPRARGAHGVLLRLWPDPHAEAVLLAMEGTASTEVARALPGLRSRRKELPPLWLDAAAVEELAMQVFGRDPAARLAALELLGGFGPAREQAFSLLSTVALEASPAGVRAIELLGRHPSPAAGLALLRAQTRLEGEGGAVARGAFFELPPPLRRQSLRAGMGDANPLVRRLAAELFSPPYEPQEMEQLLGLLDDPQGEVRAVAARALAPVADRPEVLPHLRAHLSDPYPAACTALAEALARGGGAEDLGSFQRLLQAEGAPMVVAAAARAILTHQPERVWELLAHPSEVVRQTALDRAKFHREVPAEVVEAVRRGELHGHELLSALRMVLSRRDAWAALAGALGRAPLVEAAWHLAGMHDLAGYVGLLREAEGARREALEENLGRALELCLPSELLDSFPWDALSERARARLEGALVARLPALPWEAQYRDRLIELTRHPNVAVAAAALRCLVLRTAWEEPEFEELLLSLHEHPAAGVRAGVAIGLSDLLRRGKCTPRGEQAVMALAVDPEEPVRRHALLALGPAPPWPASQEAPPEGALEQVAAGGEVSEETLRRLYFGVDRSIAVAALLAGFPLAPPERREELGRVLGRYGRLALPGLLELASRPEVRSDACRALGRALVECYQPMDWLAEHLPELPLEEVPLQAAVLRVVNGLTPETAATYRETLEPLAGSPFPGLAAAARGALGTLPGDSPLLVPTRAVRTRLSDADPEVRWETLLAVAEHARWSAEVMAELVQDLVADPDPRVRRLAWELLAERAKSPLKLSEPDFFEKLEGLLTAPNPERCLHVAGLARAADLRLLNRAQMDVRPELRALLPGFFYCRPALFRSPGAGEHFSRGLRDPEAAVRRGVAALLRAFRYLSAEVVRVAMEDEELARPQAWAGLEGRARELVLTELERLAREGSERAAAVLAALSGAGGA